MGWPYDEDGGPDADYGVFGDAHMPSPPIPERDPKREAAAAAHRKKRAREAETGHAFNRQLIDLYNQARRTP